MIRKMVLLPLAIILVSIGLVSDAASAAEPDFLPGQEWSIKSTSPTPVKIIIGHIGRWRDKVFVSVSLIDIPIRDGVPGVGGFTQIAHAPFEHSALVQSVDRLLATGVAPAKNFEAGYEQWKKADGGIFSVPAEKVIEMMFDSFKRDRG